MRGRSGAFVAYSSMACAIQPAVLATAKIASPAPGTIPPTLVKVARAKSMFGSGRARRRVSSSTAAATEYLDDLGAAFLTRSSSAFARGSALCAKAPKPGIRAVGEVTETGYPPPPAQQVTDHAHRVGRLARRGQHRLRAEGSAAVGDGAPGIGVHDAAERAQAGRDQRVRVRAYRRRHPGGEGGRGEFMVGEQGHRRTQRAEQHRIGPLRADLVPEPAEIGRA